MKLRHRGSARSGTSIVAASLAAIACGVIGLIPAVADGVVPAHQTVLVLGSRAAMSPLQQQSARRVVVARLKSLGFATGTVKATRHELVVTVHSELTGQQRAELAVTGKLFARPITCFARGPANGAAVSQSTPPLVCGPRYALNQKNIDVQQAPRLAAGYTAKNVKPDPAFDHRASTRPDQDALGVTVLLSSIPGTGHGRYLCTAGMSWSGSVRTAAVDKDSAGSGWDVYVTFTNRGSAQWDRLSRATFHRFVAVELDGVVLIAPLVQPTQSQWSSFSGEALIPLSSKGEAEVVSFALSHGFLPTHVTVLRVSTH